MHCFSTRRRSCLFALGVAAFTTTLATDFDTKATAQSGKPQPAQTAGASYRDVAPILKARCVVCHNHDSVKNAALSGGLALDSYAALKQGVGSRPTFVAGKSADSEIFKRLVTTNSTQLMPKGGPALPTAQIALFKRWIDAGATEGAPASTSSSAAANPDSLPMPINPAAQEVSLRTVVALTPDLLTKTMPKDAALELALKIGPLPPITALAFSPDGKRLAVGGYRTVILWDTTTGHPIAFVENLAGPVQALAYRPDGSQLAVAGGAPGMNGEVKVYDAKTLALIGSPITAHTDQVLSVAWSADGGRLITGSQDRTARIWEWPSGKELKAYKDHSDAVTRVCFAPDGKSIYTACQDHNLRRFDATTGTIIRVFTGHADTVTAMAVSPNGKSLVSGGAEPEIRWWNPDTGDVTARSGGHTGPVNDITFSKDGALLASASADHSIRLWDGGNGGAKSALMGGSDWMYSTAISPDRKVIAGAGADGLVRLWEAATGRLRLSLVAWPPAAQTASGDWAAITPEGYFDGSPAWSKKLHLLLAGQPVSAPRLTEFAHTLHQPDNVLKGWQGAALAPAQLPTATVPVKATSIAPAVVKPAASSTLAPPTKTSK